MSPLSVPKPKTPVTRHTQMTPESTKDPGAAPTPRSSLLSALSLAQNVSGAAFAGFALAHFAGHVALPFTGNVANAHKLMHVLRWVGLLRVIWLGESEPELPTCLPGPFQLRRPFAAFTTSTRFWSPLSFPFPSPSTSLRVSASSISAATILLPLPRERPPSGPSPASTLGRATGNAPRACFWRSSCRFMQTRREGPDWTSTIPGRRVGWIRAAAASSKFHTA